MTDQTIRLSDVLHGELSQLKPSQKRYFEDNLPEVFAVAIKQLGAAARQFDDKVTESKKDDQQ